MTNRQHRIRNHNHKKNKPSDPYDYGYNALTTMLMSTTFGSHQVLMLLTTTISIEILVTLTREVYVVVHCPFML